MSKSSIGTMTEDDKRIISMTMGFTLGFGVLCGWEVWKQATGMRNPTRSIYVYMVHGEFWANVVMAVVSYLLFTHHLKVQLWTLLLQVTMWTLQIQLLPQIIINRINVILGDRKLGHRLKWGIAGIILIINISVYIIWIPALLGVSETMTKINYYWDRIEKSIYLVIDAGLNWFFIKVVKQRLVNQGSKKYNRLVTFNIRIIIISLAMDVLIIASMQFRHTLLYSQFHPLAFMVKLRIELSMASLIRRIASEKNEFRGTYSGSDSRSRGTAPLSGTRLTDLRSPRSQSHAVHELSDLPTDNMRVENGGIIVKKQVVVESVMETTERERERGRERGRGTPDGRRDSGATDQRPLNEAVTPHGW